MVTAGVDEPDYGEWSFLKDFLPSNLVFVCSGGCTMTSPDLCIMYLNYRDPLYYSIPRGIRFSLEYLINCM